MGKVARRATLVAVLVIAGIFSGATASAAPEFTSGPIAFDSDAVSVGGVIDLR